MGLNIPEICTDCDLSETRTNIVCGDGPTDADIMFVAEAPGENEDLQGTPLYRNARTGAEFNYLLARHGFQRHDVYVTNIVKCRPVNNKNPSPHQLQACAKWLDAELELIKPKFVIAVGYFATQYFLPGATLESVHGIPFQTGDYVTIPIYHPASGFHDGSRMLNIQLDFRTVAEIVKGNLPTRHLEDEYGGREEYHVLTDEDLTISEEL